MTVSDKLTLAVYGGFGVSSVLTLLAFGWPIDGAGQFLTLVAGSIAAGVAIYQVLSLRDRNRR